jgi:hypothetical protein
MAVLALLAGGSCSSRQASWSWLAQVMVKIGFGGFLGQIGRDSFLVQCCGLVGAVFPPPIEGFFLLKGVYNNNDSKSRNILNL